MAGTAPLRGSQFDGTHLKNFFFSGLNYQHQAFDPFDYNDFNRN